MLLSEKILKIKIEIEMMRDFDDIEGLSWLRGRLEALKEAKPTEDDPIDKEQIEHGISFLIKSIDSIIDSMEIDSMEIFTPNEEYTYEGEL